MRILMVTRLASGLTGVLTSEWLPSGSPAVYRLVEALDGSQHELRLVFTPTNPIPRRGKTRVHGLTSEAVIVPCPQLTRLPSRLRPHVRECVRTAGALWFAITQRPDVCWFDRTNVLAAALCARILRLPVVLRVLGVTPALHAMPSSQRPYDRLLRWAFRSPFRVVICTQDGSGGDAWLARVLRPDVRREVILNGVDKPAMEDHRRAEGPLTVVLLGRLEDIKRPSSFIDAFGMLSPKIASGVVVGEGSLRANLEAAARASGSATRFVGAVAHQQVQDILAAADVYVSLNDQGDLSNATLEALAAGVVVVLPPANPRLATPEGFERAVLRLSHASLSKALAETIHQLYEDSALRERLIAAARHYAAEHLQSWEERVNYEIQLIEGAARITQ